MSASSGGFWPRVGACDVLTMCRESDFGMWGFFNAKERDVADWTALLEEADAHFEIREVWKNPGARLGIIEVGWKGEAAF